MQLEYEEQTRQVTLATRGLDFADAENIFAGLHYTLTDDRKPYGETRYITAGFLHGRLVFVVWTYRPNGDTPTHRRIISMRKANEREIKKFSQYLDLGRR